MFGQCACLYARTGLVVHLCWIGNWCESKKKNSSTLDFILDPRTSSCFGVVLEATTIHYKKGTTNYNDFTSQIKKITTRC
jgi:hypothetical protein